MLIAYDDVQNLVRTGKEGFLSTTYACVPGRWAELDGSGFKAAVIRTCLAPSFRLMGLPVQLGGPFVTLPLLAASPRVWTGSRVFQPYAIVPMSRSNRSSGGSKPLILSSRISVETMIVAEISSSFYEGAMCRMFMLMPLLSATCLMGVDKLRKIVWRCE